jgi:hypothetical protein
VRQDALPPDEIAAHVERLRQRVGTAREAAARLGHARIEQKIGRSLGVVVVDAWGELLEVRLDREGLRVADLRTVDREILHAIHAAEERAGQAIDEYVRSWG